MKVLVVAVMMILSQSVLALSNDRLFDVKQVTDENGQVLSQFDGGLMTIGENTIKVQLYGHPLCGTPTSEQPVPDCFTPALVDEELEIDSFEPGYCGDSYLAEDDKMPVDGAHVVLNVSDYTRVLCKKMFFDDAEATMTFRYYNRFTTEIITKVYNITFQETLTK